MEENIMKKEEIARKIITFIEEDIGATILDPDTSFADYGIDSLELVGVVARAEIEFNIEFSPDDLENLFCLSDLVTLVEKTI